MKVYVDVSNLLIVDFVTGIQRVVREVVVRMLQDPELEVVLLSCAKGEENFSILDNEKFLDHFWRHTGSRDGILGNSSCTIEELEGGAVFFDIDSVWGSHRRRSSILPILKNNGLKLAVFIHDIIPVTYPQYCHENTAFFFMNYLAAYLQYADIVITSTQSTLDEINSLVEQLSLPPIKGFVTWLGSDFAAPVNKDNQVSREAKAVVKKGKYILCVGTIEPRKNHKLLLDAYDERLAELGINLVFAGRIGWNVEEFKERMQNHPKRDRGFYHLSGQNDATIDYLYRNAYVVAFPTFEEGFGLPMIEAIERNCVLAASDVPVLKEVGKDLCDYFNPNCPQEFISLIEGYINNPSIYDAKKEHLKTYVPVTWDTVTSKMSAALKTLKCEASLKKTEVKQMVILSARTEMLLETLPFIENYMDFIKEVVICCPDKTATVLQSDYRGRLKLTTLTDSEVLNGAPLPEDHTTRNMYLRCLAMKNRKLDDVFIMSDDDYRPLKEIHIDKYIKDGKYVSYYCFNLEEWTGTAWEPTSFDSGMKRTAEFLQKFHYPCRHYASHMPQIIDKRIFLEMLEKHPGMEKKGYCEWCTYFNYLQYSYPSIVEAVPYKTMGWPGNPTDWKMQVVPDEFLYENFYEESYEEGAIFEGISREFTKECELDNIEKIKRYTARQNQYLDYQKAFDIFSKVYVCEYRELPRFGLILTDDWQQLTVPRYLLMSRQGVARILFEIRVSAESKKTIEIDSYYNDSVGNIFCHAEIIKMPYENCVFDFPLYGYHKEGNYTYNLVIREGTRTIRKSIPISIMR